MLQPVATGRAPPDSSSGSAGATVSTPSFDHAIYYSDGVRFAQWIQETVEFIISDEHPVPFQIHCALGADRTGAFCETIGALCDANWDDLSYDYYRTSELRIEEYRHPNTIRYCLRHMCGVDPATDPNFNEAVKQHFIQGGWLTADQIAALKAKLNRVDTTETALENQSGNDSFAHKFIKNGVLYIERNGITYTVTGQKR